MTDEPRREPTRLGPFDITCVVVGGIIGIGIFFTPAKVAAVVGSSAQVVAAWGVGGVMVLLGALVYARLGQLAPGDGGVFAYLLRAFGPLPAFVYGWCNLLVIQSGALAIVALVMVDYLAAALGRGPFGGGARVMLAIGVMLALTLLNALGLRFGRGVQIVLTVVKTAAVFGIVAVALFAVGGDAATAEQVVAAPRQPVGFFRAMSLALLPVLFACGGWQQGSFVSAVARRPQRDVPIGTVAGVVVVVVAYLTVNLAYLDTLGIEGTAKSKTVAADTVRVALGGSASAEGIARVFAAVIVVSALGIMNTICMAPPYVLHAMARRGLFFAPVGRLHARFGTPLLAILVQGGWAVTLLAGTQAVAWSLKRVYGYEVDSLGFLLDGVVFVDWLFYGACGVALLVLLRRRTAPARGDAAYAVAAVLFATSALLVAVGAVWSSRLPSAVGLAVVAVGIAVHRLRGRRESEGS